MPLGPHSDPPPYVNPQPLSPPAQAAAPLPPPPYRSAPTLSATTPTERAVVFQLNTLEAERILRCIVKQDCCLIKGT